jgi:hypothetical protein
MEALGPRVWAVAEPRSATGADPGISHSAKGCPDRLAELDLRCRLYNFYSLLLAATPVFSYHCERFA